MMGWSGVCYQFYKIWDAQSYQSQRQIIDIDGYTNVKVDQDSQLFIYSFPREDCIRLDELLNSIRSEYVKIYGAQAILLIWDIILHHDKIRKKQKIHGNLTSRNVWIVLNQKSERFRCIFSKLDYKIHFTGYQQIPLNNEYDFDNECSSVVADILNVLEYCQSTGHKQKQSNQNINLAKIKSMLFPLVTQKQKLLDQIAKIIQEYLYLEDEQRFLNLDCEQYTKINYRGGSRFQTVADTIKIIYQQKPISQLITLDEKLKWRMTTITQEIQFWELLPKIVQQSKSLYYNVDLKKDVKQIEPSIIELIQTINGLKSYHYGFMLQEFQKELDEEFGIVFKIEIKLDQQETETHYMNLFRAAIAEHMNDLDSFRSLTGSLTDKWLKNKKEFEATIFKRHKPYLLQKHEDLFVKEIEALIASLL